jgi:vancomycin aglycone glucosyltransferase
MADQPYFAGRIAELGIGAARDGRTPTVASLSAAIETALAPAVRARAGAVAPTIRPRRRAGGGSAPGGLVGGAGRGEAQEARPQQVDDLLG